MLVLTARPLGADRITFTNRPTTGPAAARGATVAGLVNLIAGRDSRGRTRARPTCAARTRTRAD